MALPLAVGAQVIPIPANAAIWGTHDVVEARKQTILRAVLADAVRPAGGIGPLSPVPARRATSAAISNIQKVGLFYATCMDSAQSERAGLSPLRASLDRIAAVVDIDGVRREAARLQSTYFSEVSTEVGVPAVFVIRSRIDPPFQSLQLTITS
jgi:predicted metalloendopeptidase